MGVLEIRGQRRAVFRPREFGGSLKQSRLTRLSGDSVSRIICPVLFLKRCFAHFICSIRSLVCLSSIISDIFCVTFYFLKEFRRPKLVSHAFAYIGDSSEDMKPTTSFAPLEKIVFSYFLLPQKQLCKRFLLS